MTGTIDAVATTMWTRAEPTPAATTADALSGAPADELAPLMARYQQGDARAADELIAKLSPMLLRFFAGPIQTRDHAQDMLQDCWLRIHRSRHTYRPDSPVLPWVFAIARHTRVDGFRKRSSIERRETFAENLEAVAPARAEESDLEKQDLWALLEELPESQREVIRMLKVAGMSLEETALATGSSVGSVKQKAHRAYNRLRELLLAQGTTGTGRPR